jgi:hypothetical protein
MTLRMLKCYVSKNHLFVDDACRQDLTPESIDIHAASEISTVVDEGLIQNKHALSLMGMNGVASRYRAHLFCCNISYLGEKDWSQPIRILCPQCKTLYELTFEIYEYAKSQVPERKTG